jgi:hypothetical protein
MKRLTYEFVKESFESYGYKLLSKKYIDNKTGLDYVCSKGHKHYIRWGNWQQGKRCPTCAGQTKPTIEQVRKSFEKNFYILLSKEYINSETKLDYICSNEHKYSIAWTNWVQGSRCPSCAGNAKPTLEQIKKSFEQERYTLLSQKYINNKTKIVCICPFGHRHAISWDNWQRGKRCSTCYFIRSSGSGNPNWNGGTSYEPYCPIWSDKEYKEDIKLRDGYKCLNPTCNKKDSRLHIHHIDYNKKNCEYKNVITLCGSCNSMANTNREWHTAWYQALMYMRYNYKY